MWMMEGIKNNTLCGFINMSFNDQTWKGYEYFDYYFDLEYPYNLSIQGMIINYVGYIMPIILHQICFIRILFKIRSRLWKRHIKPFRWS